MEPYRIVIDTNVVVSALRSKRGASFVLMNQSHLEGIQIAVSVPLVVEYEKAGIASIEHTEMSVEDIEIYIDYLCSIAKLQKIYYLWRPFLRDPNDDMVLELAIASSSQFIITFNKRDFVGIDKFGIMAVTPQEFLNIKGEIP
ncbi:MAG: putative toxin-antitoxin system toxin component, PIN family [Proteobacteria bacterium]|nr:putative toxin-antitoxin system toxin component, PIN family [Pseudomonadota bacterium]